MLRFLLSRGIPQRSASGAPRHRPGLFASYRADDLHRRHALRPLLAELVRLPAVERLELRPMADAEVARLVRAVQERPLPDRTWTRAVSGPDVSAWAKAVAAFDYGDAYERARCRLRHAEALLAADDREAAATEARAARETAARLGAAPLLQRLDALIRRGRLAQAAADRSSALTARERDVLRLLALGRSNRQIGEELYITGKTASVHVSDILAELGAASRTEAVALAAHRKGLVSREETVA
ncbi:response regulator transcription factor [Streptomyces viridochromogenes]|uniref:helix-turn-helix transcriptional regulator n=1 Tax=Streptomyces viridochromogenes TaxID=1938 RepID=UPI00056B73FB